MKRVAVTCGLVLFILSFSSLAHASVYSDTNRFTYGVQRILMAPFQIPIQALNGTMYGPPGFGTVGGVLTGAFRTVGDLVGGLFDMTAAAAPYAKYAVFAL